MDEQVLAELLATLKTATGDRLDYIGGRFGVRRSATLDLDFASTGRGPDGVIGTWRDVEPDADYRKRIVPVVKEAAAREVARPGRTDDWRHCDATQRAIRTASVDIVDRPPDPDCTWSAAAEAWSSSNERATLYNPPDRPDGFAQSAVDAAKAVLLATAAKRGAK